MTVRLGGALKELRIHLCQTSKQSEGVREFIQKHYVNIKTENPDFPILIRECSGTQPRIWARYEKGRETSQSLIDFSHSQVLDVFRKLAEPATASPKVEVDHKTSKVEVDHSTSKVELDHVTPKVEVDHATPKVEVDHTTSKVDNVC